MKKIINQTHSIETFLYATSKTLERASYYGIRSIILLYMVNGILKMDDKDAINIYGWFITCSIFSQIIGAIIGDLLIGNKRAIIIGGIIQSLGAFTLCIPSNSGLFIGLILVVFGGGLYTPSLISNFGKTYLDKTKLLDSGFTIFYFAINIGAFFGVIFITSIGEKYGYNIGFIVAGITMLFSIVPILFSKSKVIDSTIENKKNISNRIIKIAIAIFSVSLFWSVYELGNIRIFDIQLRQNEISTMGIPKIIWSSINSVFLLPISLFAIVLWSYFYSNQFFKLIVGFIFATISFGILFLIPNTPNEQHIVYYLISILFLAISEIHIAPIIYSILTQYTNPKYLAILISLVMIPTKFFSFIIEFFNERLYEKPTLGLIIGMITMTILIIGLIIYNQINKKYPIEKSN